MTRTLVVAERPFRDLRSRAALREIATRLREIEPLLLITPSPACPPGFAPMAPDADRAAFGIGRVVLAGAFQERRMLEAAFGVIAQLLAEGARLEVLNFLVAGDAAQPAPPRRVEVLDAAPAIELRDFLSADTLTMWRVSAPLRIAAYPETGLPADTSLAGQLPEGPLLGLSIMGGERMRGAWQARVPGLRELLARASGWPVVPLPAEAVGSPTDDLPATLAFIEAVLPGSPVLLPELADPMWRQRQFTASRLKGLAARCALVATNQDLPAAMAIASGVPTIGIALADDRRITACLATLANALPPGSELSFLPAQPPPSRASSSARA
jgi:hypothetical protein